MQKKRTVVITVRLSQEEHRLFQRVADKMGMTISAAIRHVMRQVTLQ